MSLFEINRTGVRPVLSPRHQSRTHRILTYVDPFLPPRFIRPQQVIEEFWLPKRCRAAELAQQSLCRPFLPLANDDGQCARHRRRRHDEEMHMIWHDDISPDRPAMPNQRLLPFLPKNVMRRLVSEQRPPTIHAGGDEIGRLSLSYATQTLEMPMFVWHKNWGTAKIAASPIDDSRQPRMRRFLLYAVVLATFSSCARHGCVNEVRPVQRSPDGKRKVVLFTRNCDATTGFNTQASILDEPEDLPDEPGNAFILDRGEARVSWNGDGVLLVVILRSARIFKKEPSVRGVTITYREARDD